MELLDGHFTRISSKIKLCSIVTYIKFPWCSGYHICLTRRRSPVRSRTESSLGPLYAKKLFVSDFSQNLYKHPPRCPDKRTYIRFWNKSLLKSYRNFYIFCFFNSAVLSFKIICWIFLLPKAWAYLNLNPLEFLRYLDRFSRY